MAISEAVLLRNPQFRNSNPKPTTNPRNPNHQLGFQLPDRINNEGGGGGGGGGGGEGEEMMQKPLTPILDRFTALVKEEREDIVRNYEIVLAELCFNAKPIITELTVIAGEQRKHGQGIADAICDRIIKVPSEQKLPSLYLLDSIVKNVGFEYKKHFASRLYEVFCTAYRNVQPNQHSAMQHLFRTWKAVFPASVLQKIGDELQFSSLVNHQSSASVSCSTLASLSTQGVNVNPKLPESEDVTVAIQDPEEVSARLERYGQMNHPRHVVHDIHQTEILSNPVVNKRLGSPGIAACVTGRAEMLISTNINSVGSSPLRVESSEVLSPSSDGFQIESSPKRVIQNASEFQYGLPYEPGRVNKRDVDRSGLWAKHSSVSSNLYTEAIKSSHLSNRCDKLGPRALIKAYGRDTRDTNLNEKPVKIDWPDTNGINNEAARTWQNTEEEEYVWEEMSPTVGDRSRSDDRMSSNRSLKIRTRNGWGNMAPEPKISFSRTPQLPLDDSAINTEGLSNLGCGSGAMGKNMGFGLGTRSLENGIQGSYGSKHSRHSQHNVPQFVQQHNLKASGKVPSSIAPTLAEKKHLGKRPLSSLVSPQICPPLDLDESHTLPSFPTFPQQKQQRGQIDLLDARKSLINQGIDDSSVLGFNSTKMVPHQLGGPTLNNQNQGQSPRQEPRESFEPQIPVPSHLSAHQSFGFGNSMQGHAPAINSFQLPGLTSALIHSVPNPSFQLQGGQLPQLPLRATPPTSMMSPSQNIGPSACQPPFQNNADPSAPHLPAGGALTGLINSLVSQGLISLAPSVSVQDSVGVEFNADVLKVRNESVITALYGNLPRQCTTCGLRFKCREEHSAHMDWHVTRNRASKNRKHKPSRNWFASTSVWLSSAEALGTDTLPGFVPTETTVEKNDYEEIAVPADENQNACALCGECFDDFYSDENEEWMYRGAVYMNEPDGSAGGGARSQLGPIVHAKCLSGSAVISTEDCGLDQAARVEEDSQRNWRGL